MGSRSGAQPPCPLRKGLKGSVESVIDKSGEEGAVGGGECLTSWCIKLLLINLQAL